MQSSGIYPSYPTILQERHYYPFGMLHAGYGKPARELYYDTKNRKIYTRQTAAGRYKYWYNGKEWQDDAGLNWNAMDYRNYDPALGRFTTMDPFAPLMPSWTPYKFAFNNPIVFSDPLGLYEIINGGYRLTDPDEIKSFMGYLNTKGKDKSIDDHLDYIADHFLLEEKLDEVVIDIDSKTGKSKKLSVDNAVKNIENQITRRVEQRSQETVDHWEIASKGFNSKNYWEEDAKNKAKAFVLGYTSTITGGIKELYKNEASLSNTVKGAKIIGRGLTFFSLGHTYYQYSQGQISGLEATLDASMTLIALFGPVGFIISTSYFVLKTAYDISGNDSAQFFFKLEEKIKNK